MKKYSYLLVFLYLALGCKTLSEKKEQLQLRFLDEYVFPVNKTFKNTVIGGLSGITYTNKDFFLAVDDAFNPRVYKAKIKINNNRISAINFLDVIFLDKKNENFYAVNHLDLESVIAVEDKLILASEGRISRKKNPFIFQVNKKGNFETTFKIPEKFLATSKFQPRHNGVFESLSNGVDGKSIWSATEYPLKLDGEMAQFSKTKSPVRFTKYSLKSYSAEEEFVYEISPLSRSSKGDININGITDILEYKKNHFLVMERSFQSGYKNNQYKLKIFEAVITPKTTNSLSLSFLNKTAYVPMKKRLVFDLDEYKSELTDSLIDNLEGITFGPKLPNGNQSLIIVSDDNFQRYGKQLNQFLLLEMIQ